jgi:hypothetical protein
LRPEGAVLDEVAMQPIPQARERRSAVNFVRLAIIDLDQRNRGPISHRRPSVLHRAAGPYIPIMITPATPEAGSIQQ